MVDNRINVFNSHIQRFGFYSEQTRNEVLKALGVSSSVTLSEAQLPRRFALVTERTQDKVISLLACAQFELDQSAREAAEILASLPSKRKRPSSVFSDQIKQLILDEKLYLQGVKAAAKRVNAVFKTTFSDTVFSSRYQKSGPGQEQWPARDFKGGHISEAEARNRVLRKFEMPLVPVKKRRVEVFVKNREPLPVKVQKYILNQKLYLLTSADASRRIANHFNIKLGETSLSSAFQRTGEGTGKWPGYEYKQRRISQDEARSIVQARFTALKSA